MQLGFVCVCVCVFFFFSLQLYSKLYTSSELGGDKKASHDSLPGRHKGRWEGGVPIAIPHKPLILDTNKITSYSSSPGN